MLGDINMGKVKKTKTKCTVESREAFRRFLASFTMHNTERVKGIKGFELLHRFMPKLTQYLSEHKGIKFQACVKCLLVRTIEVNGEEYGEMKTEHARNEDFWIDTTITSATSLTELQQELQKKIDYMKQQVSEKETVGSGWVFKRVLTMEMHIARYRPLKGSSYLPTPPQLQVKKAIVNVQNKKDNECFKWAVLSAMFPASKHSDRLNKYTEHESKLDWTGFKFPVKVIDIGKFESRNNIAINVYGCDENSGVYIMRKSKLICEKHIDLFLIESDTHNHYTWIKHFSRFAHVPSDGHRKKCYCRYCLHGFLTDAKLQEHLDHGCREITDIKPEMPKKEDATLQFTNTEKRERAPFVIYADFECLTVPSTIGLASFLNSKSPEQSYTEKYQDHTPCGYCIYIVSADTSQSFEPLVYRGENTVEHFITTILDVEKQLCKKIKAVEPMQMTAEQEHQFQCQKNCRFCEKELGNDRVRDHDHLTGAYRGAAHSKCNIEEGKKRTRNYKVPVFFHNLKGYDAHLIVSEVGRFTSKLEAIPQNYEKFISFSFSHLRFLDSIGFLNSSLDKLSENLYENGKGKDKFVHSAKYCDQPQHLELILRKGVYPYDYMNDWSRMDETELPPQDAFYSKLSGKHISDADYEHAQTVWKTFGIKTLGEYHDLYVKTDVLILADVFESFRDICLDYYELDPAHYFTTPNFAWDCMLKK
eukprot:COSAG05_NODE_2710_length_2741_cov_1.654807_2_plen_702_part_01